MTRKQLSETLQYEVNDTGELEEINIYNNNGILICTLASFLEEYEDAVVDEILVLPTNEGDYSMLFEAVNQGLSYSPSVSFRAGRSTHRIVLTEDGSKKSVFKTYEYSD